MNDHQQFAAERGRRAADLRAAAVALLEQQAIASGVMLDLDSDQVVAAGPKSAILYLMNNGAPAATSGDAPADLQQLKALALAYQNENGEHWYNYLQLADGISYESAADFMVKVSPAVVLDLIARIERATAPHGSAAPTEAVPVPFRVGNEYQTQTGEWVRFVGVAKEGTDYETMFDEKGVHRYTSRDFGRVTGTAHDYSYPDNTPPLYRHPASQRAAVSAATKPTADADSAWKQYIAQRTQLMDTSSNRAIFAAGYSAAATKPTADLSKAIGYAIYGINGAGQHVLHDVKTIPKDDVVGEWMCDDDGLGDRWAGNEPVSLLATKPAGVPEGFADWLSREMPAGTVIADPAWWAPRIIRALAAAPAAPTAAPADQNKE